MIYDWTSFRGSHLYRDILIRWNNLLSNVMLKEQDYHHFLKSYPAIFLAPDDSYLVISKLKLGSDYETDFVVVKEGYSDGTQYEIIEIESPHTKLFDNQGKPSSKFNSALQQIRDWRRWLIENKPSFYRIFPTTTTRIIKDSKISFKIIIGRRSNNQLELERRRQISEEMNVEIFSYDRLTDIAIDRKMFYNESLIGSSQMIFDVTDEANNKLANPFYECISDSDWKKVCKNGSSHIYPHLVQEILRLRTYNQDLSKYIDFLNQRV